jgi:hypothetical protein
MSRTRADRRNSYTKSKSKAARNIAQHVGNMPEKDPNAYARFLGRAARTPKVCSKSWCCGNPRKHWGPTKPEKSQSLELLEESIERSWKRIKYSG